MEARRAYSLIATLGLAVGGAASQVNEWSTTARAGGLEGVFGKGPVSVYRNAKSVKVYRCFSRSPLARPTSGSFSGELWPVLGQIGKPVVPSVDWVRRFRAAIDDPGSHEWGVEFKCGFRPGLLARFSDGARTADILFCFDCNEISFWWKEPGFRSKKQSFRPSRVRFLRLFREIFPKDAVLQALPLEPKR